MINVDNEYKYKSLKDIIFDVHQEFLLIYSNIYI